MGSAEGNLAIWDLELDGSEWLLFFFSWGSCEIKWPLISLKQILLSC